MRYVPDVNQFFELDRVIAGKRLPYTSRARIIGSLEWSCPRCAKINLAVMSPGTWRVTCKRSSCHLRLVPGIRLGVLHNYRGCRIPIHPTDKAFPECELIAWRSGEPIHMIAEHPSGAAETDIEKVLLSAPPGRKCPV
jgi:phage FluMu protein Com